MGTWEHMADMEPRQTLSIKRWQYRQHHRNGLRLGCAEIAEGPEVGRSEVSREPGKQAGLREVATGSASGEAKGGEASEGETTRGRT